MHKPIEIEREWRTELDEKDWANALELAAQTGIVGAKRRVTDLVFGRHGEKSVAIDGWVVRVRKAEGEKVCLELKEKLSDIEWRETSVEIGDANAMVAILRRTGFSSHLLLDRIRTTYIGGHWNVVFDDFPLLGRFVEVEEIEQAPYEASPLDTLVQSLSTKLRLPPYGQIVRERAAANPEFEAEMAKAIANYRFEI